MPFPTKIDWHEPGVILTANTAKDGTGSAAVVFRADEETYIERVVFSPIGSNVATAARIFANNGGDREQAKNNVLLKDITLPISTLSEVASMPAVQVDLDVILPKGWALLVTIGTTVAAGYAVAAIAGDYPNLGP